MINCCGTCKFELWLPIAELEVSTLGLYSDARFPGRSLLRLQEHWEDFESVPEDVAAQFMEDMRRAGRAIKKSTNADRLNYAVLGNAVPHVHAHLIPRVRQLERFPNNSPWDDPREKKKLPETLERLLMESIGKNLSLSD